MSSEHLYDRRSVLRIGATAAVALSSTALLSACGGLSVESGGGASGSPVKGGSMRIGMIGYGSAETMNVPVLATNTDFVRSAQIFEQLFSYRGKIFAAVPQLASGIEVNRDATVHTVALRDDVTWHDGKPFTADDVVWTLRLWEKDNPTLAGFAPLLDFSKISKVDDHTVRITTTRGIADLPGIMASSFASSIVQDGVTYNSPRPVGTGPFVFESFAPGRQSTFKANEHYWGGRPNLDQLVVDSSFQSETTRFNALSAGSIDVMPSLPFALVSQAQGDSGVTTSRADSGQYTGPAMRVDRPPFNDPRVATAMKLLVDRDALLTSVYSNIGQVSNDVGMRGVQYYAGDLTRSRDLDQAKSLLKAAGQANLSVPLYTSALIPGVNEIATLYAQQAKEAGVSVDVRQLSATDYYSTTGSDPYLSRAFGMSNWLPMNLAPYYLLGLNASAPFPESHFGDPESDALLYDALGETDSAKAAAKWHAVQEIQFNRGGYIIPVTTPFIDAFRGSVGGVETTSTGPCDNYNFATAWKS